MYTKYGQLPDEACNNYITRLKDRVFKILWMKEQDCSTTDVYIDSLIYELCGINNAFYNNGNIVSLIGILSKLKTEQVHSVYRQKIFQCVNDIIPSLFEGSEKVC